MFKSAATKIAHNSTLPVLAGKNDLKLLQDIIASEKLVLQSLQKFSVDFTRSSEALRHWGLCEGEDLGDTFSACTTLMAHFSASLASFSSHVSYIRECLKAVRTREEVLDEQHRRRKALFSRADAAEKKLNKMSPENKNLRQQTDALLTLREQIRGMDVEIMNEEAALGDWKRIKAREWMGVLFGGLLECSEKGTVVATYGRSIISHIPVEQTEPGLPRAPYSGHAQVEPLVVEAERQLQNITFSADVGLGSGIRYLADRSVTQQNDSYSESYSFPEASANTFSPPPSVFNEFPKPVLPISRGVSDDMNEFGVYAPVPQRSQTFNPDHKVNPSAENILGLRTSWNEGSGANTRGGQFATFPTKPVSRPSQTSRFSGSELSPGASENSASAPTAEAPEYRERRLSSTFAGAPGTGWNMGDEASLPTPAPPDSREPPSATSTLPTTGAPPSTNIPSATVNYNPAPVKSRDRRPSHRLSSSVASAPVTGWSVDGGAPRLDASSSFGPPEQSPPASKPPRSRSPSAAGDSSASLVKSGERRLSDRLSSSVSGSGWSMDDGVPHPDDSSFSVTSPEPSHTKKSPTVADYPSSVATPGPSGPRAHRLSEQSSAPNTTALGTVWNMDGGTLRLDDNFSLRDLQAPPPTNGRSRSPSADGRPNYNPTGEAPNTLTASKSREGQLSQRSSTSFPTALGVGWNVDGTPHVGGNVSLHDYADPPPSYVPVPSSHGASPSVAPGSRDFEHHAPSGAQDSDDDNHTLAYMSRDDSQDRTDRRVRFGGGQNSPTSSIEGPRPEMDEGSLNAQAARELSKQIGATSSPLAPPSLPFTGRRSGSPRPSVVTDSPNASHIRDRDPISLPNRSESLLSFGTSSVNETYRTPLEYPNKTPAPRMGSASASLTSPLNPGNKTISAAAFRRPNMRPAGPSSTTLPDDGLADTSPLKVQKRSLPGVPGIGRVQAPSGGGAPRVPSVPTGQGAPLNDNGRYRTFSGSKSVGEDEGVLDDAFDYIGAYVDSGTSQPAGGYRSGRFVTNLSNQGSGLR